MKLPLLLCLFGASLIGTLFAQKSEIGPRHARFLAVGEAPPFQQDIRDGIRYELEPPAGSIPPREVMLGFDKEKPKSVSVRLGRITEPLEVPGGEGILNLRKPGEKEDTEPWLRLTRPEADDFLVLLWRDATNGTWEKARTFVISEGPLAAPAGSIRFVNIAAVEVGISLGEEKLILGAGKVFLRRIAAGTEQPFQVLMAKPGSALKRIYSGTIVQNQGERSLVLVYQADGVSARSPLKVTVQREAAPAPLP